MSVPSQVTHLKKSEKIGNVINQIAGLITNCPSGFKIIEKYTEMRILMGLPSNSFQTSQISNQSPAEVAVRLLGDWLAGAGNLATVGRLQDIFLQVELQDFYDAIESKVETTNDNCELDGEHDNLLKPYTGAGKGQMPPNEISLGINSVVSLNETKANVRKSETPCCKRLWKFAAVRMNKGKNFLVLLVTVVVLGIFLISRNLGNVEEDSEGTLAPFLRTTETYSTLATTFPKEPATLRVHVQSYMDYQSQIRDCNHIYILIILSKEILEWPSDFSPICRNQTQELHINGILSSVTLLDMLKAFPFLRKFTVGTVGNITGESFLETHDEVQMRCLTSLQLHCRKCTTLYGILADLINLNQIIDVTVKHLLIYNDNYIIIQKFFSKLSQIMELKINVELGTIESFFPDRSFPLVKVLEANFSFNSPSIESEISLYDNFRICDSFPELQTLISSNWPYMFKTLRTCRHLIKVYLIVNDDETERFRDLTVFSNHMPNLRYLDLLIIYPSDISCPTQNILGLSKLQCKQLLMYDLKAVNCPIQTCPATSYKLLKSTPKCSIPPKTHKNC